MALPTQPHRGSRRQWKLRAASWLCLLVTIDVFFPSDARAYLDPGTGSMLIQVLVGGVAGTFVIVKMQWARIQRFFGAGPLDAPGRGEDHDDD